MAMSKKEQEALMQKRRNVLLLVAVVVAVLLVAIGVGAFSEANKETAPAKDYSDATNPVATITMEDGGQIVVELYPVLAPNTVANFVELANSGFYDGLIFHRVIPGFMIQGGDPKGNGTGGPGYSIKGEFSANGVENDLSHTRGVISMARAQDFDSAGSQFFIMHADADYLDGQYAAFGMVTEGMDVVDQIASTKTDVNDKPLTDMRIASITVETNGVDYVSEKIGQ